MYVIGLTGNIATGKSTVARLLSELGAEVLDADLIAHEVMRSGSDANRYVVQRFGQDVLRPDGEIDRVRLGAIVFSDTQALVDLEAIVHPAVVRETLARVARSEAPVVVIEAIKLLEAEMHVHCDAVWVVTSPRELQVQRLVKNRGLTVAQAEQRIDAQSSQDLKVKRADVVIENSEGLDELRTRVLAAWRSRPGPGEAVAQMSRPMSGFRSRPRLLAWGALALGMVLMLLAFTRERGLAPGQLIWMSAACVAVAGLCIWIVSWEARDDR